MDQAMRQVWFLLAGCLAVLEVYLALGTNSASTAPLQNDLKFAAFAVVPVGALAFLSVSRPASGARTASRGALVLLALGALTFGLAGYKIALLLCLALGGWLAALAAGCAWVVGRAKA
jgi:hypothetical protein